MRDEREPHLYVVEFDDGTIKVGYTVDPEARIKAHAFNAGKFRISIIRHWVSEPHVAARLNEKTLIAWCKPRAGSVHGEEWYTGLSFDEVRDAAAALVPPARPRLDLGDEKILVSISEGAQRVGLYADWPLRALVDRGVIPYIQVGPRAKRLKVSDLREYVEAGGTFAT